MNASLLYREATAKPVTEDISGIKLVEQQKAQAVKDSYNVWLNSLQTQNLLKALNIALVSLDEAAMNLAASSSSNDLLRAKLQQKFAVNNVITMIKENKAYVS